MALIPCPACGHQVADTAKSCPSCGAQVAKPRRVWPWVVGVPVVGFLALMVFGATVGNTPEAQARAQERRAIDYCWEQQQRKSLDPGSQRFVAGACEKMEADFLRKHGVRP